jgi:hypothetical protein
MIWICFFNKIINLFSIESLWYHEFFSPILVSLLKIEFHNICRFTFIELFWSHDLSC